MTKSKKTIYNAVTSVVLTLLNGLFSILIIQKIVISYGSDFNGLNSTVSQFVNFLLVIEGGFTLATTVALFQPLENKNYDVVNSVLSASHKSFKKIGFLFFTIGSIFSLGSLFYIKTDLPNYIIFYSFFLTIFATSVNLAYSSTYKAFLQTNQREYNLNIIQIVVLILTQILTLLSIHLGFNMILIRVIYTVGALLSTVIIVFFCKKEYPFINVNETPDFERIKGTKDLIAQKITSVIYGTAPILFISMTSGTKYVSVYVIYNSIFNLVKNLIYAIVNAPRAGFGVLLSERDNKEVYNVFKEFEFIIINLLCLILSITMVLILPFVKLYTKDMNDVNYMNSTLPIIISLTIFFEIIHIPSGNMINMAGKFKVGKNIQLVAALVLITSMVLLNIKFSFLGVLGSVLVTSVVLATLEIYYVHKVFFQGSITRFIVSKIPIFLFSIVVIFLFGKLNIAFPSYSIFVLGAIALSLILGLLFLIFNFIFYKKDVKKALGRFIILLKK